MIGFAEANVLRLVKWAEEKGINRAVISIENCREFISESFPDVTEQEVMILFLNYGAWKENQKKLN